MNGTAVKDLPIEYNFQATIINFYWYQSFHSYQWTIGIALYPARLHQKII